MKRRKCKACIYYTKFDPKCGSCAIYNSFQNGEAYCPFNLMWEGPEVVPEKAESDTSIFKLVWSNVFSSNFVELKEERKEQWKDEEEKEKVVQECVNKANEAVSELARHMRKIAVC